MSKERIEKLVLKNERVEKNRVKITGIHEKESV